MTQFATAGGFRLGSVLQFCFDAHDAGVAGVGRGMKSEPVDEAQHLVFAAEHFAEHGVQSALARGVHPRVHQARAHAPVLSRVSGNDRKLAAEDGIRYDVTPRFRHPPVVSGEW